MAINQGLPPKRIQLTLFLDADVSESIEHLRQTFNPEQYALIPAHVTLCREDELEQIEQIIQRIPVLELANVTVDFGQVARFSDGKGVMIPASGDNAPFQALRAQILQGFIEKPRRHEPHITLMHPRNSTCTDAIFEQIQKCHLPERITFRSISLIQQEMGQEWKILNVFVLKSGFVVENPVSL